MRGCLIRMKQESKVFLSIIVGRNKFSLNSLHIKCIFATQAKKNLMEKNTIFTGAWRSDRESVKVRLALIMFTEDDSQIVYCPALDVSGYGKTESEAKASFEVTFSEFLRYTLNKKTFRQELEKLGWKLQGKHKPAYPPSMQHLLENNDNFNRIFNDHAFSKFDQQFEIPVT